MWFDGHVKVRRSKQFEVSKIGPKRVTWRKGVSPYGAAFDVDPWSFAYAATRASVTGAKVGLRGQLASGGLSVAALAYFFRRALPGTNPPDHELRLHTEFSFLKDFVGASLKGNIGAAFAYLEMQNLGYAWSGHFEDCTAVMPASAHPDFVFAKQREVCLVDAKGSTSDLTTVESTAKLEWSRQIRPCSAVTMKSGGVPTEGRVIASAISPSAGLQLVAAYGRFRTPTATGLPIPETPGGPSTPKAVMSVQRANYIDICYLLGLDDIAGELRRERASAFSEAVALRLEEGGQKIDGGDLVYLSPATLTLPGEHDSWSMQPFCRVPVLSAAVRKFSNISPEATIPISKSLRPAKSSEDEGKADPGAIQDQVIVQGLDGAGAIFRRQLREAPG